MQTVSYTKRVLSKNENDFSFDKECHVSDFPFIQETDEYFSNYIRFAINNGYFVCGHEKAPPGYYVNETSKWIYFMYIVNGKGVYNDMPFKKNDFFWMYPKTKRKLSVDQAVPWEAYWCVWKGDFIENTLKRIERYSDDKIYHLVPTLDLVPLFNFLIYNIHRKSKFDLIVNSFTNLLISDLQTEETFSQLKSVHFEVVQNICEYIDKEFLTTNVEEISNVFHFNRKHLAYIFKKIKGITMQQYIQKTKLRHAEQYLLSGSHSIDEIYSLSGYSTYSAFIKAFNKEHILTPSEYIKINKL